MHPDEKGLVIPSNWDALIYSSSAKTPSWLHKYKYCALKTCIKSADAYEARGAHKNTLDHFQVVIYYFQHAIKTCQTKNKTKLNQ